MTDHARPAAALETVGLSKHFQGVRALDDVSLAIAAGEFHVLLGENGAGKSTLVKCIMGAYRADRGEIRIDGKPVAIRNPRDASRHGLGMVYQHFTLIPALTGVENLVLSRPHIPAVIDWAAERASAAEFVRAMRFDVPLDRPAGVMAAGEKQKLEILKQLYLGRRLLVLDEPTSVLTPAEADVVLGMIKEITTSGRLSVLMITHKFNQVTSFADRVTVLRHGRVTGSGTVGSLSVPTLTHMMVGRSVIAPDPARSDTLPGDVRLEFAGMFAQDDLGRAALAGFDLKVRAGEIVGIAGISGNGQRELVEIASGQREATDGAMFVAGRPFRPTRTANARHRVFCLPEEPLRNALVPRMSVAENIGLRSFDKAPAMRFRWLFSPRRMRAAANGLAARYRVVAPSLDAAIETLSGGNVQRAVLARELSGEVDVLIVANPCFGLDFATVAEIRAQIVQQRNRGAAVLLITEDLDEILLLADRVAVICDGRIVYRSTTADTDRLTVGRHMGGSQDSGLAL